jgi:hypothetical protein
MEIDSRGSSKYSERDAFGSLSWEWTMKGKKKKNNRKFVSFFITTDIALLRYNFHKKFYLKKS